MSLLNTANAELDNDQYVIKQALIYLQMKKVSDQKVKAIRENEDNQTAMKAFFNKAPFLFIKQVGEGMEMKIETPNMEKEGKGKKQIMAIKTCAIANPAEPFPTGIHNVVQFMECNKPVLDNLRSLCEGVFMPILGNPLNQQGWSDLVSKDLMDKFHSFCAYTVVTIGLIDGKTVLPLPQSDVTSSEKTSSKDKSLVLENAIVQWSRQIRNVLKQDPENVLKSGAHPDPIAELDFWRNKSENLNSICHQLNSERIKKVLKFLEQNKSTYTSTFSKLQKEVQAARTEANENYKYLKTLNKQFKMLTDESLDLNDVADTFVPIMHTILMIWTYSPYYNTPARLVVLIREICNAIISQCQNYVSRDRIFESISAETPAEAHQCLSLCIDVCARFKEAYFDYKAKSKNQWKITTNALFVRLDAFSERCQDIMHLTGTIMQFNKLQKIEIGNTKGKTMTNSVMRIFEEFGQAVDNFTSVKFDIMDIDVREFDDEFFKFRQSIKELERRLASVLTQSFDDCDTIIGKFKLLDSFEGLLTRQIIMDELEKKHVTLLELFKHDLKTVSNIFHEGRLLVEQIDERAPIANNMPPIAGALNWTAGLLERVKEPFERLDTLSSSIKDREEYKDVQKLYMSLVRNLREFEDLKIQQWVTGVEENTADQLNKFLLVRQETDKFEEGYIYVNFDPILKALLREVKYLLLLDLDVPQTAQDLYARVDVYRQQTGNLELIVDMYNGMLESLLRVEKPLLKDRIERMSKALQPGIDTLRWNSENINPFISSAMKIVTDVDVLVAKMKQNVSKVEAIMETWKKPLFERRAKTAEPDLVATIHNAAVEMDRDNIKGQGKEIQKTMKDTLDNIKPDKKGQAWLNYVDYVNSLIIDGVTEAINASMEYMADQINIKYNTQHMLAPIFEIGVELSNGELCFHPTIECNDRQNGITDIINSIVDDFVGIAILIPRLDSQNQGGSDFLVEIKDQFQLFGTQQEISANLLDIRNASAKFLDQYRTWDFLWKEDVETSFNQFLASGPDLRDLYEENERAKILAIADKDQDQEEFDNKMKYAMQCYDFLQEKIFKGVTTRQPDLTAFDRKIEFLHSVKNQIDGTTLVSNIGWLKVTTSSLVKKLYEKTQEWIEKYTQYLLMNTNKEIDNIREFIDRVSGGIKELPEASETQAEKDQLMEVMIHLRDVRMVTAGALARIEPMKEQITLLRRHQVAMDPNKDQLVELEMIKAEMKEVSDFALSQVKAKILPIQKKESENIKEDVKAFRVKVDEFRKEFKENCPYHVTETSPEVIQAAYEKIQEYHDKTEALVGRSVELRNLEGLFDITESKFKPLDECRHDLSCLKRNWDLIGLVDFQFDAWKKTLWDAIDTDGLIQQCRDMASKQTNPNLNKEIKSYKSFMALNDRLKNMSKLLPLIGMLHSKYMQDRHWAKLMAVTCKRIGHNEPSFCLHDLLVLELHKYEQDVEELVESAAKEDKIDNNIRNIIKQWDKQKFTFEDAAGVPILADTGDIVELVEQHGMDIQSMLGQKDVAEFREVVSKWRGYMTTLEQVIEKWKKVQGDWKILRPIFIESEDIQAQLPEATVTFTVVHEEFKELMAEVQEEPLVIPACTAEGRFEKLKMFESEIEVCQKALNDQLESKQKLFPRFYFVSKEILLTILSNGGNPEKVNEFMGDCFDGMNFVRFNQEQTEPGPLRIVNGMEAKDGEVVPWNFELKLQGAPEVYLGEVERGMQRTLIEELEAAKQATERWNPTDLPREVWLEEYMAQIALLTTQITWTEETISAFDEVEQGAEGAMKDNYNKIVERINKLIDRTLDLTLTLELRTKIITIITVDVHGRDIVNEFVVKKTQDATDFLWQKQLKFGMDKNPLRKDDPKQEHQYCVINICDWQTWYSYEYVGNLARLVITPLTDKCYVTLTQALNLLMGAAPAGPAGTGKTETTKDLGRALGLRVVVYNCSDQMNFKTLANIFMGLAQSGFWGCFDEFNRISIDVLSVCSSQVKNVLDALVVYKATNGAGNKFIFMNADVQENIEIKNTVGFFITMNPGYAGRTELPENLKAQFRYCSMVVPDIILICENMLMSEGFKTAKALSNKFMTLYDLCKSLLSEQTHYDWGLRAVKSLLRQAGQLKRAAAADEDEDVILLGALRDFNIAKIIAIDVPIFMGLIDTLFPNLVAEQAENHTLRACAAQVAQEAGLQTDPGFILKNEQVYDILNVRHSIFIIGAPGAGKSAVWKNLAKALSCPEMDWPTIWQQVDPKAVNENELVGWENLKTKEWRDGVLSSMFRNMVKCTGQFKKSHKFKWVVLDGDVDPNWIESMNTVMDDNKVLTLVSNERIPLTPSMRLIIEVANLRNATPATVSRGGVSFVNDADIGWTPYYESWKAQFKKGKTVDEIASTQFTLCQTHYLNDSFFESLHTSYDPCQPMVDIAYIMSLTTVVDHQMKGLWATKKSTEFHKNLRAEAKENADVLARIKTMYDCFFAFGMIWSFGSALDDSKRDFNGFLRGACRTNPFPEGGMVYDYFYDPIENKWCHWMDKVKPFDPLFEGLFSALIISTAETERQKHLLELHKRVKKGVLYVGTPGTGKTTIVQDYFADTDARLDDSDVLHTQVNFNNYTTSESLQGVVESKVEKRTGALFGPPVGKTLIYFVDDLNMPVVDVYFTQQPIALVRQLIDYGTMYNRADLSIQNKITDCMFVACMNPKSGSFFVDTRLTRHLTTVCLSVPEKEILSTIYSQLLTNHFSTFDDKAQKLVPRIIAATQTVFMDMSKNPKFAPTAKKFFYQFNMRDFGKIVQNLMNVQSKDYRNAEVAICRLWVHECHRVWRDRLINPEDLEQYAKTMDAAMKGAGLNGETEAKVIFAEPLIYTSFVDACKGHDPSYRSIKDIEELSQVLHGQLEQYNENIAVMDLVLFNEAMEHITRCCRIVDQPNGHCLLVGVGGSGKQSLSKLSAFILGIEVFRIVVSSNYGMNDLKEDIKAVYMKAGAQGNPQMFILTDTQIISDKFLMYINDILSVGYVAELFAQDEVEEINGRVRSEARANQVEDTPTALFGFFLDKCRKNLHLNLCFSPVGDAFRIRSRMFPGLLNATTMDYHHAWPQDALIGVAARFLEDVELDSEEIRQALSEHMAFCHLSIDEANAQYLLAERRNNYVTPTSFLELIKFYRNLLANKRGAILDQVGRLKIGLQTMEDTNEVVAKLSVELDETMVIVEQEKAATNELIAVVDAQAADAAKEEAVAKVREDETNVEAGKAQAKMDAAEEELKIAVPLILEAEEAVNCLNKPAIDELKSFGSPSAAVLLVVKAILTLYKGEKRNYGWDNGKKMMKDPNAFLAALKSFDKENISDWVVDAMDKILEEPNYNEATMKKSSTAAASLCVWSIAVCKYNKVYKFVKPLEDEAAAAKAVADQKMAELAVVQANVAAILAKVADLQAQLQAAEAKKQKVEDEAAALNNKLDLANRLVGGLADENARWKESVKTLSTDAMEMIGNALLSSAFVSYIGPFSQEFRSDLWRSRWLGDIVARKIPYTDGVDPLSVLSSLSVQAGWKTEGLPADRISLENAAIITNCSRYPLMIDPQLQGMNWIQGREGGGMTKVQLSQRNWGKRVEQCITNGNVLMLENLGDKIDAVLDPLLSRAFVKKGKATYVKLGAEDVEMSPHFRLYLQTKMQNPHYIPEVAAQCTIINFIVTESGLEDQLLAEVVRIEKPELEQTRDELVAQSNQAQITLAKLSEQLLTNLSDADPATILENFELIEGLETTKKTAAEIEEQQKQAKITEVIINQNREVYRPVAAEGAMLYFLIIKLYIVDPMYMYSLESFSIFFYKAIAKAAACEDDVERVESLVGTIRMTIYQWIARGLFQRHKQIFLSQLTFRLMQKGQLEEEYNAQQMAFLINCPLETSVPRPVALKDWLSEVAWYSIQSLIKIDMFDQLAIHIEKEMPRRFQEWYNELAPENCKLPGDWKMLEKQPFQKMLVTRCLRPDRITSSLDQFVRRTLPNGNAFVDCDNNLSVDQILANSYEDSSPTVPMFFILSPGANPIKNVISLARQQGYDPAKQLTQVALGQGQDVVANALLDVGHKDGGWVMLQNVHLMPAFLYDMLKRMDGYAGEGSHPNFRVFLTSDPTSSIPIELLQRSIKLTNEPPAGFKANMSRAFASFKKDDFEEKDTKIKTILFGLVYFHTVMSERKKFGPKGFNMVYPFSEGDLSCSAIVLTNYMEGGGAAGKIPWNDLKYLIGEIMYGGHIVNGFDLIICLTYLDLLLNDGLLDEAELFPFAENRVSFKCPVAASYDKYVEHIETELPPETPLAFGLHPNAEIAFLTTQCVNLFNILVELQPKSGGSGDGDAPTTVDLATTFSERIFNEVQVETQRLPLEELRQRLLDDQRGPYQNVYLQECELINTLINLVIVDLKDLELAFKGELTMTGYMEKLMEAIELNRIPTEWAKKSWKTSRALSSWVDNLKQRLDQLNLWKDEPTLINKSICFLNRLYKPNSFLTAIKQVCAQKTGQPLNKLYIQTDVTKRFHWEPELQAQVAKVEEGCYCFGFLLEGASWDKNGNSIEESLPKQQYSALPVVWCKALLIVEGKEEKGIFKAPVYMTTARFTSYVFMSQLRTRQPAEKWVLAGAALILDVEGVSDAFYPGQKPPEDADPKK